MRKSAALVLLLSLFAVAPISNAHAQSRARRVGQTAPAPVQQTTVARKSEPVPNVAEEVGDEETVRVSTTLVTLPVSIMDRDGRYIPDLRKEDFRVWEDGVEQQVAYFATTETAFTVALVLDTSGSTQEKLSEIQDAAIAFVNQLRPDDRVIVISFDERIEVLSEATSDRYRLRDAIRRTTTGGGTRLYDAVDLVIKQRLAHVEGRKAVVLFTDGVDTTSKRASYNSTVRDAEELDALIYPVQFDTYADQAGTGSVGWPGGGGGRGGIGRFPFPFPFPLPGGVTIGRGGGGGGTSTNSSREDYERGTRYLSELAAKTGGRIYQAAGTRYLERAFSSVAEELRRQYSLGYYPKNQAGAGVRRRVRVSVNRQNLAVKARDSYIFKESARPGTTTTTAQDNNGGRPQPRQSPPELRKRQFSGNKTGKTRE